MKVKFAILFVGLCLVLPCGAMVALPFSTNAQEIAQAQLNARVRSSENIAWRMDGKMEVLQHQVDRLESIVIIEAAAFIAAICLLWYHSTPKSKQ